MFNTPLLKKKKLLVVGLYCYLLVRLENRRIRKLFTRLPEVPGIIYLWAHTRYQTGGPKYEILLQNMVCGWIHHIILRKSARTRKYVVFRRSQLYTKHWGAVRYQTTSTAAVDFEISYYGPLVFLRVRRKKNGFGYFPVKPLVLRLFYCSTVQKSFNDLVKTAECT